MPPAADEALLSRGQLAQPFAVSQIAPGWVLTNPLAWVIWALDFGVWLATVVLPLRTALWWVKRSGYDSSISARPSASDPDSVSCRRRKASLWEAGLVAGLTEDAQPASGLPKLNTFWAIWVRSVTNYGPRNCLGTREYLGVHKSDQGARKVFGTTSWRTYSEVSSRALNFGKGLRALGLEPLPAKMTLEKAVQDGSHSILIFEETCADWITSMLGAFSQSVAVATSYATLGIDAVVESANECAVSAIFCNYSDVAKVVKVMSRIPSLKTIIYTHNNVEPEKRGSPPEAGDTGALKVVSVDEVVTLGAGQSGLAPSPPAPETVAVVMYTSGSTGKPKGVVITHGNIAASVSALMDVGVIHPGEETYLAYLPAAHILELVAEFTCLSSGCAIGYACPKTITSKGACRKMPNGEISFKPSLEYAPGAIQEFRPTIMAGVPLIWDTMKKAVEEQLSHMSGPKQFLFQAAYSAQWAALKTGRTCPLINALIFKKIAAMAGGRLRVALSGGGAISSETQSFIRTAMGCELLQGYALTETCCAGAVQMPGDTDDCIIGPPFSSVEIKLRSVTGAEEPLDRQGKRYLATDTDHCGRPCQGRGEICIRGPSVSLGYFKKPEQTREVFQEDGWFRSGDVGMWDTKGRLIIVDRIKNLVKLRGGEYIALENMEKEYQTSTLVNGMNGGVMCYGDGDMTRPVALVQVNLPELLNWAKAKGVTHSSPEELCKNKEAEAFVLKSLQDAACSRLGANEKIVGVKLIPGTGPQEEPTPTSPWTPDNGLQTASKKLNRKPIMTTLKEQMDTLKKETSR